MKPAIEVRGLSKSYTINHKNKASYNTIKDDFANLVSRPFGGTKRESSEEEFWALKDVNFEVPHGEIFGVVGQNGSGKSTLLKILSRIVQPTTGSVTLHGRVSSLLEVGTGFHPELTGRENIYFNGSMLGMSKKEISRKFNEIVEFSEVERFIDTPVKFYSSGMYVRLAFSVAAHLDPDILILDEVLAVGDASFQKKSLAKIISTMREGKTVLFVSHSMGSVRQLCKNGIYLDHGEVLFCGPVDELIENYSLDSDKQTVLHQSEKLGQAWVNDGGVDSDYFTPEEVFITDTSGERVVEPLFGDKEYVINIRGIVKKVDEAFNVGYSVWDDENRNLLYMSLSTDGPKDSWPRLKTGPMVFSSKIPPRFLNSGLHKIKVIASLHAQSWIFDPDSSQIRIQLITREGLSDSPYWKDQRGGFMAPVIEWSAEHV